MKRKGGLHRQGEECEDTHHHRHSYRQSIGQSISNLLRQRVFFTHVCVVCEIMMMLKSEAMKTSHSRREDIFSRRIIETPHSMIRFVSANRQPSTVNCQPW